jgi:hypothetical protein
VGDGGRNLAKAAWGRSVTEVGWLLGEETRGRLGNAHAFRYRSGWGGGAGVWWLIAEGGGFLSLRDPTTRWSGHPCAGASGERLRVPLLTGGEVEGIRRKERGKWGMKDRSGSSDAVS